MITELLPLSLYIHIPWCQRKCPYCDFNSHTAKGALPEDYYVQALLGEIDQSLAYIEDRPLISIFFGGGTPSLFSPHAIQRILTGIHTRIKFVDDIEITLEANPGTIDQQYFKDFKLAGINRLSLGIQSLQNDKLKALGRIHDKDQAMHAINIAKAAGFTNFNLDLMYGLPNQTLKDALSDLKTALSFEPAHFSWYQLTLEPNTLFYHQPPPLPSDELAWEMQLAGQDYLKQAGFNQYEVSAYALRDQSCRHNLNYWEFGDYLGIGAGAHSKLSDKKKREVVRFSQVKHPKDYLDVSKRKREHFITLSESDLIFEFMLNALRLTEGFPASLFVDRTGLPLEQIEPLLSQAKAKGFLENDPKKILTTPLGKQYLNDFIQLFLK